MTLTQLRYLVAIDRHRSFTRAAEACGVAQPTLSTQIRKLEEELEVTLFHRDRFRVRPTDIGAAIVEKAERILAQVDQLRVRAAEAEGEVAGELRLGVIPTVGPFVLPRSLPALVRRHPGLSVVVTELTTSDLLNELLAGRIDAALLATAEEVAGLEQEPLFDEPFVAYLSSNHPLLDRKALRREDLKMDDLWLLREGHCFRDQVLDLCGNLPGTDEVSYPLRFESGNLHTLKRLVDETGGMTLLPKLAMDELGEEERSRVRPFVEPAPVRTVTLVHGRTYMRRAARDAFVATLLETIGMDAISR